ncbi:cysteine-rich secretory protein 2-like [Lithobates pipiens]
MFLYKAIYPEDIVPCDTLSTHKIEVQEEIVAYHNEIRSTVTPSAGNMLQMTWSDKLMESAERWAKTCNLNHSEVKDRNDDGIPFGENILSSPACVKWTMAIKQWYNERVNLIWGVGPKGDSITGHYLQMVTDHTFNMGCAMNTCNVNGTNYGFFVCQYWPPGNRPSSLYTPYDKGEPCSQCPKACSESGKLCLNSCGTPDTARNCLAVKSAGQCEQHLDECKATCLCKNKIT